VLLFLNSFFGFTCRRQTHALGLSYVNMPIFIFWANYLDNKAKWHHTSAELNWYTWLNRRNERIKKRHRGKRRGRKYLFLGSGERNCFDSAECMRDVVRCNKTRKQKRLAVGSWKFACKISRWQLSFSIWKCWHSQLGHMMWLPEQNFVFSLPWNCKPLRHQVVSSGDFRRKCERIRLHTPIQHLKLREESEKTKIWPTISNPIDISSRLVPNTILFRHGKS
jgi:hypothetical protein